MKQFSNASLATLALLLLVLPGVLSAVHMVEHDHGFVDGPTFSSVVTEQCEQDGTVRIEGAELVENERCQDCILNSRSKSGTETGNARTDHALQVSEHRLLDLAISKSTAARPNSSRAPPAV